MIHFQERLWPSPGLLVALVLLIPATLIVFLPIDPAVGVVMAIAFYLAATGVLLARSPRIRVDDEGLSVGVARLPADAIGEVLFFEGVEATAERSVRLDARAWLAIRGGISPVVRVEVTDQVDPAPYWLVSTRRPRQLKEAVEAIRPRTRGR
ncbi:DUF3093 domain-containing protein [Salinibacterium sp. SYSU T00001]|uniref:DUF3093 domain-containing protein n=1 Tax=Homoserinimonas sedimenticola TaxID=2986805 RepID=UPI00223620FF|nr:DUF3093 domain-containing protein [Salinibacterium sedimenticola]MCW4384500.1 DUF3093 domain-containing protein [Salinibacterium sedimenticola]